MDQAILIGLIGGAGGYLLTTFFMRPILCYHGLRQQVLSDLIFYADVITASGLNQKMEERYLARVEANRRHSADLTACILDLPSIYRYWLRMRGQCPETAAAQLIGLSNTATHDEAARRIGKIKECLGITFEGV